MLPSIGKKRTEVRHDGVPSAVERVEVKHEGLAGSTEKEFLEGFRGKLAMSIGSKHSGKSVTLLAYVRYALEHELYDEYHMVLPTWEFEENDSYAWLKKYKTKAKIYVYSEHDQMIIERLQTRPRPYNKAFFGIDDSTGSWKIQADAEELKFLSRLRHFGVTQWIVVHTCRAGLPASLRSQIDFLFLFMNTNRKALEAIYEEWLSISIPTFKEFMQIYKKEVLDKEYSSMLIWCRKPGVYDTHVKDWKFVTDYVKTDMKK